MRHNAPPTGARSARRAVLWDMDGVLVDSGPFHFQAWSEVLPDYGIAFDHALHQATFGLNNARILAVLLGREPPPELLAEVSECKEERFRRAVRGRAELLPGVLDWLERNRAAGAVQAVASSAPLANLDALLDELRLRRWFQAIVSGVDLPGKPDPALFLEAARRLQVSPGGCIVVEDAVAGVEAAKRAGMKAIAVTTTNPARHLAAADRVVERLDLLPADAFERLWDKRRPA